MTPIFFALFLMSAPSETPEADLSEARELYSLGSAFYDAEDYEKAIEKFTEALAEVAASGSEDFQVRGLLLYNIGRAHVKAYHVNKDITHLYQAQRIYTKFIREADTEAMFDEFDSSHVDDARKELRLLETILTNLEGQNAQDPLLPPPPPKSWKKPRNLGIGLVTSGSLAMVGGIALASIGAGLEDQAKAQVAGLADLGVPADHPAWSEGDDFIAAEKRRGNILMGVGISAVVLGAAGTGIGSFYLVKSKKLRMSAQPSLSSTFAGIRISGSF